MTKNGKVLCIAKRQINNKYYGKIWEKIRK